MLLDDTIADAESETSALSYALGGVKGIEDAIEVSDSSAIITEKGAYQPTLRFDAKAQEARVASFENGVDGVVDDVDEHLLDLVRIGNDDGGLCWRFAFHFDVVDI